MKLVLSELLHNDIRTPVVKDWSERITPTYKVPFPLTWSFLIEALHNTLRK